MLSINFKVVLPVLLIATVVKEATATTLLKPIESTNDNYLVVIGSEDDCKAVAAELSDVSDGTKSVNKIGCHDFNLNSNLFGLVVDGSEDDCKAVAAELSDISYQDGTKSVNKIGCSSAPKNTNNYLTGSAEDANVLNLVLIEKIIADESTGVGCFNTATATELAEVKTSVANAATDTATDLAEVKASIANTATATDLAQ